VYFNPDLYSTGISEASMDLVYFNPDLYSTGISEVPNLY